MKLVAAALATVLLLAACSADRQPIETRLKPIRTYGWSASVVDPAPDWNPSTNVLVARSIGGFSLLEEGGRGERAFDSDDRRESHTPIWLNRDQFVFGPARNAIPAADGTISTPSDGLTVATINAVGKPARTKLSDRGFRPRRAGDSSICAQDGNLIIFIDAQGQIGEFGEGFDPEPQPDGPGLCWRDRPAFDTDFWTGRRDLGTMFVRWSRGQVDNLGNAVQAAWTRHGGVIATVLEGTAPAGSPWWSAGTHLVHSAGPGAPVLELRAQARDPAPHPLIDLLAWTDRDGGVWIGSMRPDGWSERIAESGWRPRWNPDGMRLCYLESPKEGSQIPAIRVVVLALR